jgi:hypothetical protein
MRKKNKEFVKVTLTKLITRRCNRRRGGFETRPYDLINGYGKISATAQDYRFGNRAIFKQGKLVKTTKERGNIDEGELVK